MIWAAVRVRPSVSRSRPHSTLFRSDFPFLRHSRMKRMIRAADAAVLKVRFAIANKTYTNRTVAALQRSIDPPHARPHDLRVPRFKHISCSLCSNFTDFGPEHGGAKNFDRLLARLGAVNGAPKTSLRIHDPSQQLHPQRSTDLWIEGYRWSWTSFSAMAI